MISKPLEQRAETLCRDIMAAENCDYVGIHHNGAELKIVRQRQDTYKKSKVQGNAEGGGK
jgi:hypothetical protein